MITWILLLDVLKVLRSRRLFWLATVITILIALVFASIDLNTEGISIFFGALSLESDLFANLGAVTDRAYGMLFSHFFVGFWLSTGSVMLALVATSSIVPDFLTEGSSALTATRPVSRAKIYLVLSLAAVLFAILQALIFCTMAFAAIFWRLGEVNFTVFWPVLLVPLTVLVLQSFGNWFALRSKAGLMALLAAISLWAGCKVISAAESFTYQAGYSEHVIVGSIVKNDESREKIRQVHRGLKMVYTFLPKTPEIPTLMKEWIVIGDSAESEQASAVWRSFFKVETDEALETEQRLVSNRFPPQKTLLSCVLFAGFFLLLGVRKFRRMDL